MKVLLLIFLTMTGCKVNFKTYHQESCVGGVLYLTTMQGGITPKLRGDGDIISCVEEGEDD
jgi:hypothetical protein